MPVLIAWLAEVLLSTVGQLALSALISVGIGFVGSKAVSGAIDTIGIQSMLGAAGPLVPYLGWLGIDKAVTIVLSAWAGRKITDAAAVHLASKRAK